jgi:hypothetical protein
MKHSHTLSLFCSLLALAGCAKDRQLDIGDDNKPAVLGASLSDYVGTWEGYAEAKTWDDGTDKVKLMVDAHGNGVLEVGDAAPLPAPDPDKVYPPRVAGDQPFAVPEGLFAGFSYPVSDAIVQSRRIRLSSSSHEVFREWCEAMTPVLNPGALDMNGNQAYSCVDPVVFNEMVSSCKASSDPNACGKSSCTFVCDCDATSCKLRDDTKDLKIDAALESEGDELVGTLLIDPTRITVRMMRN